MTKAEIESLERATLVAVAPAEVLEIGSWLVAIDSGTIHRAKSAVPVSHDVPLNVAQFDEIEQAYSDRGLSAAFRIADVPGLQKVCAELTERGYRCEQPTLVKIGAVEAMATLAEPAEVLSKPDAGWGSVFLGEGFDPVDGASRVTALSRSPDAVYGMVREGDQTFAVGVAAFGDGWASVHGMRTLKSQRGRGHASRILAALGSEAKARGLTRVFLQVEEGNPARSLYRRAGFEYGWRYHYWSKTGA
ncbi:hypothetical protein BH11PSE2_BH11PSE2_02950 [soil metagenome]